MDKDTVAQWGLILQRGGEELWLLKVGDRFTVRLQEHCAQIPPDLAPLNLSPLPRPQLWESLIASNQLDTAIAIARRHPDVAFASHVYQLHHSPETLVYPTNELTLQFASQFSPEAIAQLLTPYHLENVQSIVGIPNTYIYLLTHQTPENPIKLANRLMTHPQVLTAEANVLFHQESFYRPQDSLYNRQWYLNHAGGSQLAANSHIHVEAAWDITRGSRKVVVAITDDAIDTRHPDFQAPGKIVAPHDFRDQDFSPLPESSQESHGTACAGVAVAEENGQGVVGVAPGCALMPLRTTGYLDDRSIEALFDWARTKGASVISCSWGAAVVHFPLSLRQRAAIHRAATEGRDGKGCVVVFAAGNANRPIQGIVYEQGWPDNLLKGPTEWLSGFATHPDVIAVSACTSLGKKSAYSNWGEQISVCAPSNNAPPGMWFQQTGFIQTAPAVGYGLPGRGIFTTDQLGNLGYDTGNFTRDFGGTSSACPVVAGLAALVLSANPDLTAAEVKQILEQTADKIVDPQRDDQLNLQLGNYDSKGHSQWFGYGKVNAHRAVQLAQKRRDEKPPLRRWTIERQMQRATKIPDGNPQGLLSNLTVEETGLLQNIRVTIALTHPFLGDVEVYLHHPQGSAVLLQSRDLGSQTRLLRTYTPQERPLLARWRNLDVQGTWQLRVRDRVTGDTGTLGGWGLQLEVQEAG
ncbi:MAG: S8 family serine peptidase [Spirulina sp. SIO3F2]|nr:S8 family serine peptidase [Spirulina sp. SIO3F2]